MAEQPKYFDIEDYQTGKKYRVEAYAPDATYEEAVDYFSGLPETEWSKYEVKAQPTQPAPASERQPAVTNNLETVVKMGGDDIGRYGNYEASPLAPEDEQTYIQLAKNPDVSFEAFSDWVKSKGGVVTPETFQEFTDYRTAIAEGRNVSNSITYQRAGDELLGDYTPDVDPTIDSDLEAVLEKGMAYNPMGLVTRGLYDLFDMEQGGFDKDAIRARYPDLSEEQIEAIHDNLIGEMRRRELINANVQVDERGVNPVLDFAGDIVGGMSPVDLIPMGRGLTVGRRLAESAAENFAVDAALQAGDISYGAQRQYDPVQGAVAAAAGSTFQGAVEAGGKALGRVLTSTPDAPAPRYTGEPIAVPTGRKNTKAYREQLVKAQEAVISQVNALTEGWTNSPDIEVHENFSKLEGVDNSAIGVYTTKTMPDGSTVPVVKINTEAVLERAKTRDVTPESVVEAVTFHEALGHHGLTSLFREDLDLFLADVYNNGSEQLRDKVDTWLKRNPRAYSQYDEGQRLVLATEEVMAEWSEKGPVTRSFYDNVANYIKDFARTRLGMNLKYTEREVRAFLAVAHERTMGGEQIGASPTVAKNARGDDRVRLKRIFPDGEGGNVVGPEDQAAKTFLNELGLFSYSELRKMPASEAIQRAERLGIDEEWLNYYNDAYLRAYGKPVPNTPQPDMARYMPDVPSKYMSGDNVVDLGERRLNSVRNLASKSNLSPKEVSDALDFLDEYYNQKPTQEVADLIDHFYGLEKKYFDSKTIYNDNTPETPLEKAEREAFKAEDDYANLAFYSDDPRQFMDRRTKGRKEYDREVERLYEIREEKYRALEKARADSAAPKYMRGDGPIDPDQLSADDLIEAKNALDILNRLDYTPTVINPDQLEAEAIARNLPPSDITRLVGMEPGKLMKKLFLYDVAATKLSDRAAKIKADIDEKGLTPERQLAYIEATVKLSDLTAQIFDFQAEIGRTLAANRRVNFSRKRVKDLKKVLEEYGMEALADPETFMKYMAEVEAKTAKKDGKAQFGTGFAQYVNIPRAIMSSADLSAPLRQGIVFIGYKEYWKSFGKMFSMLGKSGESNYQFLMKKIATDPNYELMQKARLQFSSLDGELSAREEDFQTELARKIPLYGKVVKGSEQAYAGFLNKLRADMFNRFVEDYRKAGIEPDEETLKGIGKFINAGTGRAELPEFLRPSSTILNATFFSARLMYSRVQMLNPVFYAQLPAPVRKQAGLAMLKFGSIALLVNGTLNVLFPEAETEVDPRSSDFMKVKVGNTRFDLGGGFNQYLTLGARTATWLYNQGLGFGERVFDLDTTDYKVANRKTSSGDFSEFGAEKITQDSYLSVLGDFFRSKLSPQTSYVVDAMAEKDYIGRPFTLEGSLASRLAPMTASSVYDAYKEDSPVPMPVIFGAALFGIGVNTYTSPSLDPKRELEAPPSFQMEELEDGSNEFIVAKDGEVTLKKAARDRWTETLNNYYGPYVEEVSAEVGVPFEEMDDEQKKDVIKEALKRTRAAAKKDMMYELGLSDE